MIVVKKKKGEVKASHFLAFRPLRAFVAGLANEILNKHIDLKRTPRYALEYFTDERESNHL